jgi:phosphoadenosine phosphosulfate reductase
MVPIKQINPLLKWNKESIWKYIKKYDLPANPLYTKFERVGCWCCPYKTIDEWDMLEANFPNLIGKLERKLDSFADKIGIQDKTEFIKNKKWTGWATSQSNGKVPIGTRKLCTSLNDSNTMDFAFFGNDESQAEKVKNLLPILTDDYRLIGSALRVTVEKNKNKRLNTLIEKAINCVGCGACTASCPEGALYVDSQSIFVKSDLCTHCERCLHTQILKGACVVRNYAPRKRTITAYA